MFQVTMCPSSGEITASMWHLVFVTLCGRMTGMHTLYTRQSSTRSDKYQVLHRYSYFSWCWAHSRLKHVSKRNKHPKKNCVPSWLYLQDYTWMHGQQNIKNCWIKRDQLNATCFIISLFNAQHVSDVNTSILRSLRLIYWVISWVVLLWFNVCWCYVVVWLGWCGIRMRASAHIRIPLSLFNYQDDARSNKHKIKNCIS